MFDRIVDLFMNHHISVFFLPLLILLSTRMKKPLFVLIYFAISLFWAAYAARGIGVSINAWFDFFIASSIVFGVFAANSPQELTISRDFTKAYWRHIFMISSAGLILLSISANEFVLAHYLSPDGNLARSTLSILRTFQALIFLSGITLLAIDRIKWMSHCLRTLSWVKNIVFCTILALALLPVCTDINTELKEVVNYKALKEKEENNQIAIQYLQSQKGPALFEDLLLGFSAGKECLFDPFSVSQMMASGRIREELLIDRMRTQYFTVIVLLSNLDEAIGKIQNKDDKNKYVAKAKTTATQRWTDNTLKAIGEYYELAYIEPITPYFFYVPKKSS
jgi:hypothetical protein